jgi:hypothetical protein
MEHFHEMLVEDEILMCGLVMALGIVAGALTRLLVRFTQRSSQ